MKVVTISNWLNFGSPTPPGRGLRRCQIFLALPYYSQRAAFASPPSTFFIHIAYQIYTVYISVTDCTLWTDVCHGCCWLTVTHCMCCYLLSLVCLPIIQCKQVVLLQEAKSNLLAEVERLNDRLNQNEMLDDPKWVTRVYYTRISQSVMNVAVTGHI